MDIVSLTIEELTDWVQQQGEKPFRAKQIYAWIHQKLAQDGAQMTNLPNRLRDKITEAMDTNRLTLVKEYVSQIDGTSKYLFQMEKNNIIECALMKYHYGNTVCVSSQAGCAMGCKFCASAVNGLARNLTPGEMLGQVYTLQNMVGERISHVVIMGSGEPLTNYKNVMGFIDHLNSKEGLGISQRHITLSTCGIVDKMRELALERRQLTLAVSLHAPNDVIRRQIMPIANVYSMKEIMAACRFYIEETKRRITFEYALIAGINDHEDCALELARVLKGMMCHVNVIPLNEIHESPFKPASNKQVNCFVQCLQKKGIETTVRRKLGSDINAACGQLRNSTISEEGNLYECCGKNP